MGISDSILMPWYKSCATQLLEKYKGQFGSLAFFGNPSKNDLCFHIEDLASTFSTRVIGDLYDIQIKNWDINNECWNIEKKYDIIVCLRTFYFAKDPHLVLDNFKKCLMPGGILLFDIGMGSSHFLREGGSYEKDWTFGWKNNETGQRCYGEYQGKHCELYSSFFSANLFELPMNEHVSDFLNYARNIDRYKDKILYDCIKKEFEREELLDINDFSLYFDKILGMSILNTVKFNGRNSLYFLFALT